MYFEGDAPAVLDYTFAACPAVIVLYRDGTAGWDATFAERPTAVWVTPPIYSEWLQSTDLPTEYPDASAETDDPDEEDLAPIEPSEHAVYFQSVPGKSYAVQWAEGLTGPWPVDEVVTATTSQKRVVFPSPPAELSIGLSSRNDTEPG